MSVDAMREMFPPDAILETLPEESDSKKERHIYNRSNWMPGPWSAEPYDKVHWIDPVTDMDCMLIRNGMGVWCGYVAVTEGHPAFEKDYNDVDVSVHGGLTFANKCHEGGRICHTPREGRAKHVWWLGMDFAHAGDLCPGLETMLDKLDPVRYTTTNESNTNRVYSRDHRRGRLDQLGGTSQQEDPRAAITTNIDGTNIDDGRISDKVVGGNMGDRLGECELSSETSEPQDMLWLEVNWKGSGEFVRVNPAVSESEKAAGIVGAAVSRHTSHPLEKKDVRMGGSILGDAPGDVILELSWYHDTYKGVAYVKAEVESLAKQLKEQYVARAS